MKFREILLVVLLLLAGAVVYQIQTGHWDLTFEGDGEFFGLGREFAFEETQAFEAPLPARLEVDNSHGWVEIRGGDHETIQLTFKKRIYRRKEEDARDVAGRLHYALAKTGDTWSLSTNRDDFRRRNFETGFVLTVPRGLSVVVKNSYGPVVIEDLKDASVVNRHGTLKASGLEGTSTLETSYEDLQASNIKGGCRIIDSHADVQASGIGGDLSVDSSYGVVRLEGVGGKADVVATHAEVDARRVQGAVNIETSYENVTLDDVGAARVRTHHSSVTADRVRGDLDVHTSYEEVKASNVQGNLTVTGNNAEVTGTDIGGQEISVTTSYENVSLSGFSARLALTLRNGSITLRPSSLKFPMDVRDEYGNIDLYWPEGAVAPIDAQSKGGGVRWGLAERPSLEKTNGVSIIKAFDQSAGPNIVLSTSYGDIRIETAAAGKS